MIHMCTEGAATSFFCRLDKDSANKFIQKQVAEKSENWDDITYKLSENYVGNCYEYKGEYLFRQKRFEQALSAYNSASTYYGDFTFQKVSLLNKKANVFYMLSDYENCLKVIEECILLSKEQNLQNEEEKALELKIKVLNKLGLSSEIDVAVEEILKNYNHAQEYINKRAPLILLKTHSSLFEINKTKFTNLDNSLGSPDGKKAVVGLSKYGIDINQENYKLYVNDDDSLYASANPGSAGTITPDGSLKNANNLNAVVTIYCSASETGNTFTVTGTNSSGTAIEEQITGVSSSNTAVGSPKFTTITSITSSATASGNIKIGTIGHNDINDDDSLVQLTTFSSGAITMDGVLSTSSYLGAQKQIKSRQDTTGTSFVITGIGLNNEVLTETITGSNGGVVTTSNIFKSDWI